MEQQVILLEAEQRVWLKAQSAGISGTIRMLIEEAMGDKRRGKRKADLERELAEMKAAEAARQTEAALRAAEEAANAQATLRAQVDTKVSKIRRLISFWGDDRTGAELLDLLGPELNELPPEVAEPFREQLRNHAPPTSKPEGDAT